MDGFSLKLISLLFSGITIKKIKIGKKEKIHTSLNIRDEYLCRGLMLNNKLNELRRTEEDSLIGFKVFNRICDYYGTKGDLERDNTIFSVDFEKLVLLVSEEEILDLLRWFENHLIFASHMAQKCADNSIVRKRRVASIVDEL